MLSVTDAQINPKRGFERPIKKQKEAKKQGKCRICCSFRPWVAAPALVLEQALEILSRRTHNPLTVDTPQEPQAKAPHAMPVFGFCKQGFDPHLALAQGFHFVLFVVVVYFFTIMAPATPAPSYPGSRRRCVCHQVTKPLHPRH